MAGISSLTTSAHPAAELLICCARVCMDAETAGRIRELLEHAIDWAYLLRTARLHGMMPLQYRHLNATCPEAVPGPILEELREHFHSNARRNLYLTGYKTIYALKPRTPQDIKRKAKAAKQKAAAKKKTGEKTGKKK